MAQQNDTYDCAIIGGGPAALAAAVYTGRAELKTIVLERGLLGGQVALTDMIDNYPGFPEGVTGRNLTELMTRQAKRFGAEIAFEEVTKLRVEDGFKAITTTSRELKSRSVIIATGSDPNKLGVPGEDEFRGRGVSYCGTCDGPFFRDKKVVVVGGGDTALKEGIFISKFAREILLVHRRKEFRAEKIYQTAIRQNPKISLSLDSVITRINGSNKVESVEVKNAQNGQTQTVPCDGVFIFIGTTPNTAFLKDLFGDEAGHDLQTDVNMMTRIPGIFAIGDVRKYSYRQVATAVGEGTTAAMAAEHWLSEHRQSH